MADKLRINSSFDLHYPDNSNNLDLLLLGVGFDVAEVRQYFAGRRPCSSELHLLKKVLQKLNEYSEKGEEKTEEEKLEDVSDTLKQSEIEGSKPPKKKSKLVEKTAEAKAKAVKTEEEDTSISKLDNNDIAPKRVWQLGIRYPGTLTQQQLEYLKPMKQWSTRMVWMYQLADDMKEKEAQKAAAEQATLDRTVRKAKEAEERKKADAAAEAEQEKKAKERLAKKNLPIHQFILLFFGKENGKELVVIMHETKLRKFSVPLTQLMDKKGNGELEDVEDILMHDLATSVKDFDYKTKGYRERVIFIPAWIKYLSSGANNNQAKEYGRILQALTLKELECYLQSWARWRSDLGDQFHANNLHPKPDKKAMKALGHYLGDPEYYQVAVKETFPRAEKKSLELSPATERDMLTST